MNKQIKVWKYLKIKAISFKIYYVNYHKKYILKEVFCMTNKKLIEKLQEDMDMEIKH